MFLKNVQLDYELSYFGGINFMVHLIIRGGSLPKINPKILVFSFHKKFSLDIWRRESLNCTMFVTTELPHTLDLEFRIPKEDQYES